MKLSQVQHALAVAEHGGLRRAARHLGLAQPAITRSIRDLEQELGATLFERRPTGMVPTPIGEAFVRRTAAAQRELDRARDEVQQMKDVHAGTVALGLSTAAHVSMLPRVLQPFYSRFPDVRLKITEGLFPASAAAMREGATDLYVGPLSEDRLSSEFLAEKLFDNQRVVVGRRGHPLENATSLADLANARWVTTSVTTDSEAELGPLFRQHGLRQPAVAAQAQSALSMITVAAWSDLLAMLPQQWLAFVRSSQLLVHIKLEETLAAPSLFIVTRASLPLTPVAEYLADLFRRAALNKDGSARASR